MLRIHQLTKSFAGRPETVLSRINLFLRKSECLGLLGPSGSGKTTLLRMIAGLEEPDAGEIRINDIVVNNPRVMVPPNQRKLSMVFQDLALWPHLRAWQNIEFMIPPGNGQSKAWRKQSAIELLRSVALADAHEAYPHQLSRGMQQRLALARALASDPSLLLLDEPFTSLDEALKDRLIDLVLRLGMERHLTLVYVTHTPDKLLHQADRRVTLDNGELREISRIENPLTPCASKGNLLRLDPPLNPNHENENH